MLPKMIFTVYIRLKHFVVSISSTSEDTPAEESDTVDANFFRDLDSSVSKGGENFSTGSVLFHLWESKTFVLLWCLLFSSEKQLLCMARAILKKSNILGWMRYATLSHLTHLSPILTKLKSDWTFFLNLLVDANSSEWWTIYSVYYATDELIGKTIRHTGGQQWELIMILLINILCRC